MYLYFVDAWHEEIPHRGLASGHRPAQRVFRWCTIFLVTTIDNIIVTQESLTWPQCTQTRTSNIGSCPRYQQILISNLKSRTHIVEPTNSNRTVGVVHDFDVDLTRLTPGEHHRGLRCGEAREPWNYHRFCKVRKPSSPSISPLWKSNQWSDPLSSASILSPQLWWTTPPTPPSRWSLAIFNSTSMH